MLSDKSRFEILALLKKGARYNLEIAEELQLGAPTASHHMNLLMTNGFVTIEKQDAKVYYHFIPEKNPRTDPAAREAVFNVSTEEALSLTAAPPFFVILFLIWLLR